MTAKKPTTRPPPPARAKRGTAKGHESAAMSAQREPSDDSKTSIYDSTERRAKSAPIEVISMKTPGVGDGPAPIERPRPQVKLRAISEVTPLEQAAPDLGRLAPPRDPRDVRARRMRDTILWASVAVILASVVALGVWFLAR